MGKRHTPKLDWKRKAEADTNASRVLPDMARAYFVAGRKAVTAKPEPMDLHSFRLQTKRFRYTLELFTSLYGPSMQQQLSLLKPVQDALGQVSDCVATIDAFGAHTQFRQYLARRASRKAGLFYRTWTQQFDAPGQEEAWVHYLESLGEAKSAIHRKRLSGDEVRST